MRRRRPIRRSWTTHEAPFWPAAPEWRHPSTSWCNSRKKHAHPDVARERSAAVRPATWPPPASPSPCGLRPCPESSRRCLVPPPRPPNAGPRLALHVLRSRVPQPPRHRIDGDCCIGVGPDDLHFPGYRNPVRCPHLAHPAAQPQPPRVAPHNPLPRLQDDRGHSGPKPLWELTADQNKRKQHP